MRMGGDEDDFGRLNHSARPVEKRQSVFARPGFFSRIGARRRGAENVARGGLHEIARGHRVDRPQRGATAVLVPAKKFPAKRHLPGPAAKVGRDGGLDGTLEQERADKGRVALRGVVATAPAAARRLKAREEEEVRAEPELG